MKKNIKENIIKGTLILSISNTIIRFLGFVFRIYLANTIGAEGIGLYQLIIAFYMLSITLATSGIGLAVSRIVAEELAKNKTQNAKKALKLSLSLSLLTSGIAAILLFFFAEQFSILILKDARAILPLKMLAPSLPFLALSVCYRGYFHATRNIITPSSAQLLEQITRIAVTVWLLRRIDLGSVVQTCSVAMIGMTAGEIISYLYILILYYFDKFFKKGNKPTQLKPLKNQNKKMLLNILSVSIPVAGTSYLNSALRLLENALIPVKLVASGMSISAAISIYGIIKGMVLPILFFPTSFLSSLATMLMPSLSSDKVTKNDKHLTYTLSKVLHFTSISGILVLGFFMLFPNELGKTLYKTVDVGYLIRILSILCPFMYINMVISSILTTLGEQVNTFKINLIESIIKILMIMFLVPIYGFRAYLLALFITTVLNTLLYMYRLLKISYLNLDLLNWIFKPLLASAVSGISTRFLYLVVFKNQFSEHISLLLSITSIVILYIILLFALKSLRKSDMDIIKRAFKK